MCKESKIRDSAEVKVQIHFSLLTYLSVVCRWRQEEDCRWRRRRGRETKRMQQCFQDEAIAVATREGCQHTLSSCPPSLFLSLLIHFNQPTVFKPPWRTDKSANQKRKETDGGDEAPPTGWGQYCYHIYSCSGRLFQNKCNLPLYIIVYHRNLSFFVFFYKNQNRKTRH